MPCSNHKTFLPHTLLLMACLLIITSVRHDSRAQEKTPSSSPQETAEKKTQKTTGSPLMDLIKSSQENKSQMRSIDWDTTKYKEEQAKKREQEKTKNSENEELTESQKVWKRYQALSELAKAEKEKNAKNTREEKEEKEEKTTETKIKEEEEEEKENKEEENKKEQDQPGGIKEILQRYKESQKKQSPMHSRSYGSID